MLVLRSVLIALALAAPAVVVGQPPITADCDPCNTLVPVLSKNCTRDNDIVKQIIAKDSGCGRAWDPFCLVIYNDCYNDACGPTRQGLVDLIASTGGPVDDTTKIARPINRAEILRNCPATDPPTDAPSAPPTNAPTNAPTAPPTNPPTNAPTNNPTPGPTPSPTNAPTNPPTASPTPGPTAPPTPVPTPLPTPQPTPRHHKPSSTPSLFHFHRHTTSRS